MKNLIAVVGLVLTLSAIANGKTIRCSNEDMRWTQVSVTLVDATHISFKVLDARPNAKSEIGQVANLSYRETVNPQNRVFFHYKGNFVNPHYQQTLALYLSQDLKTLTRMETGEARSWSCK